LLFGGVDFLCSGRLPERTLAPYRESLNADLIWEGSLLRVRGELKPGNYVLDGEAGSQFVSGLLMALPLLNGDSEILIKGELRSKPYVDLTVESMRQFGVFVNFRDGAYHIKGNRRYLPADLIIEGDWSHAAFYLGSNFMGSSVTVEGLDSNSLQGDRAISDVLGKTEADLADIPDLFPILAVAACSRNGKTRFFHTERLRGKESDRVLAMEKELQKLGADVHSGRDEFIVNGTGRLKGGKAQSHGDHRVAMALAAASAITEGPIILEGCGAVKKSAPHFWDEFISLGGKAYEHMGE
jgi:3-phosphoshikimate 1-carboxyvinyltransferase